MIERAGTHLRGGYLVRNPLLWTYLRGVDAVLSATIGSRERSHAVSTAPRRILLAIGGHLGDAIIASSAVELLHRAFPSAELGIVVPSWSAIVFDLDERIRWRHTLDHWSVNRSATSRASKISRYWRTWLAARNEVKAVGYDVAIDLYPYYPNMAGLLWSAGIPQRVGYTTGGRGALYTSTIPFVDDRCHIAEKQARLVRGAFPETDIASAAPRLPVASTTAATTVARLLAERGVIGDFVVVHVGAGSLEKLWPVASWRALVERLAATTFVVVTGAGAREEAIAAEVCRGIPRCVSVAGRLTWRELEALVEAARVAVAGDTSVGHLAAAHGTPVVAIYSGINDQREWRPLGAENVPVTVLTGAVPCAPCYRPNGCAAMECVRTVSVDRVIAAIESSSVECR